MWKECITTMSTPVNVKVTIQPESRRGNIDLGQTLEYEQVAEPLAQGMVGKIYRTTYGDRAYVVKVPHSRANIAEFEDEYNVLSRLWDGTTAALALPPIARGEIDHDGEPLPVLVMPFYTEPLGRRIEALQAQGDWLGAERVALAAALRFVQVQQRVHHQDRTCTDRKAKDFYLEGDAVVIIDWNVLQPYEPKFLDAEIGLFGTLWHELLLGRPGVPPLHPEQDSAWGRADGTGAAHGLISVGVRLLLAAARNLPEGTRFVSSRDLPDIGLLGGAIDLWLGLLDGGATPHEADLDRFFNSLPRQLLPSDRVGAMRAFAHADLVWRLAPPDAKPTTADARAAALAALQTAATAQETAWFDLLRKDTEQAQTAITRALQDYAHRQDWAGWLEVRRAQLAADLVGYMHLRARREATEADAQARALLAAYHQLTAVPDRALLDTLADTLAQLETAVADYRPAPEIDGPLAAFAADIALHRYLADVLGDPGLSFSGRAHAAERILDIVDGEALGALYRMAPSAPTAISPPVQGIIAQLESPLNALITAYQEPPAGDDPLAEHERVTGLLALQAHRNDTAVYASALRPYLDYLQFMGAPRPEPPFAADYLHEATRLYNAFAGNTAYQQRVGERFLVAVRALVTDLAAHIDGDATPRTRRADVAAARHSYHALRAWSRDPAGEALKNNVLAGSDVQPALVAGVKRYQEVVAFFDSLASRLVETDLSVRNLATLDRKGVAQLLEVFIEARELRIDMNDELNGPDGTADRLEGLLLAVQEKLDTELTALHDTVRAKAARVDLDATKAELESQIRVNAQKSDEADTGLSKLFAKDREKVNKDIEAVLVDVRAQALTLATLQTQMTQAASQEEQAKLESRLAFLHNNRFRIESFLKQLDLLNNQATEIRDRVTGSDTASEADLATLLMLVDQLALHLGVVAALYQRERLEALEAWQRAWQRIRQMIRVFPYQKLTLERGVKWTDMKKYVDQRELIWDSTAAYADAMRQIIKDEGQ